VISTRHLLEQMIAEAKRLCPENEPETIEWGPDRGSEIIDDAYSRREIALDDLLRRPGVPNATMRATEKSPKVE
jgi:hypothetical protein